MIIEESFRVPASREVMARYILDVEQLSRCVPGVDDVRKMAEGHYEAVLRIQLGPIRSQFAGEVELDSSAAPARITAVGRGHDQATGSQAQVTVNATLEDQPDGQTLVAFTADVTIRGRLGQFGTGVITSTAKSLVREFAQCASTVLSEAESGGVSGAAAEGAPAPRMGRVVRKGLLLYLASLFARLRDFFRRLGRGRQG